MSAEVEAGDGSQPVERLAELRAVLAELQGLRVLLGQVSDIAAELPGWSVERAAGISVATAVVGRRIGEMETGLDRALVRGACSDVVVVDPKAGTWVEPPDGLPLMELVMAPGPNSDGLCSGLLRLVAGMASRVRVCPDADVVVVVLFGAVVLEWWDRKRELQEAVLTRHQHASIPARHSASICESGRCADRGGHHGVWAGFELRQLGGVACLGSQGGSNCNR